MEFAYVIVNAATWAMTTFLVAAGLTLIFGFLHIFNFAHGALFMIGAYLAYGFLSISAKPDVSLLMYIVIIVFVTGLIGILGLAIDVSIFKQLNKASPEYMLLATYALLLIITGAVELIWGPNFYNAPSPSLLSRSFKFGVMILPVINFWIIALGVCAYIGMYVLLYQTETGLLVRLTVQDPLMASLMGIDIHKIRWLIIFIGFGLVGLAGAALVGNQGLSPTLGDAFLIQAFAVVIVGGLGSIRGAFIASWLLGFAEAAGVNLLPDLPGIYYLIALIGVMLVRPSGISGKGVH
jgi:branched-subunit amino acid ABC-type transport system permease component